LPDVKAAGILGRPMLPSIRLGSAEETPALTELINRAFVVERFFVDGDRISQDDVHARFQAGVFLVAEEGGAPVGCAFAERRSTGSGYIGLLAVESTHQRRGIGPRLMAAAEAWCQTTGCDDVEITVVSVRTELFPFYESLGYLTRGEIPFPVRATKVPCHLVIMGKRLAP